MGMNLNTLLENIQEKTCPHLILFWGGGCSTCREIIKEFKLFANDNKHSYNYFIVKSNDHPEVSQHFKIVVVPTIIEVDNDLSIRRFVGPKTHEDIKNFLRLK